MSWEPIRRGILGIDWGGHRGGAALIRCDPYMVWQEAIAVGDGKEDGVFGETREICVLIEKGETGFVLEDLLQDDVQLNHGHQTQQTKFLTLYMAVDAAPLRRLVKAVQRGTIKRLTLQTARRPTALTDPQANRQRLLARPAQPQAPAASLLAYRSTTTALRVTPLIGIIDDACPFTNAAFWDGSRPRLTALWQQDGEPLSDAGGSGQAKGAGSVAATAAGAGIWAPVRRRAIADRPLPISGTGEMPVGEEVVLFAHGRELAVDRLGGLRKRWGEHALRQQVDRDGPDSRSSRKARVSAAAGDPQSQRLAVPTAGATAAGPLPRPLPRASHGSHVMSLAAAQPDPLTLRHLAGKSPKLPVAFVQLPDYVVDDTSSRSLAAHALDGIHYLLEHAGGNPLVVNLSYGTYAGPHDGTSMFERALVELLTLNDNLQVVLPAGNSHLRQGHVHARLGDAKADSAGRQRTLNWRLLPDDPTDSFLEIWFPHGTQAVIHVRPPGYEQPFRLDMGQARLMKEDDGRIVFGGIYAGEVAQGTEGTMALIAASPTRRWPRESQDRTASRCKLGSLQHLRGESLAPHGTWEVVVENVGSDAFEFDAWIERDDAAPYARARTRCEAGRQSYFLDEPRGAVTPQKTLSGIATAVHPRLHVVGAMQRGSALRGGGDLAFVPCLSDYSSAGPNRGSAGRAEGPDVVTLADDTRSLRGLLGGGLLSGSRQRMNGTSVAAAVYTRMLADRLASGRTANSLPVLPVDASDRACEHPVFPSAPQPACPLQRGLTRRVRPSGSEPVVPAARGRRKRRRRSRVSH